MEMYHLLYKLAPSILKNRILYKIIKMEGGYMYSHTIREIFKKNYNIEIGYGTYGGCFNRNNINDSVTFGNYCSIAQNIRIFRANHPLKEFTTHPLLYNPAAGYVNKDKLRRPKLIIGHDVWIGEWSIILPNVSVIGNGAVIGAGSIVTKDIEPYSINVGNPATKIGMRFSHEQIEKIEKTRWWEYKKSELITQIDQLKKILSNKL